MVALVTNMKFDDEMTKPKSESLKHLNNKLSESDLRKFRRKKTLESETDANTLEVASD